MDTLFFIASKLARPLLHSDTWIILAMGLTLWTLVLKRHKLALWVASISFICTTALAIFPLGTLLLQPIERTYPANPKIEQLDGIIVLGGGEDNRTSAYWGTPQLNEGADRFTAALQLAHRFPEAKLLFAGGSGRLRDIGGVKLSEAMIAEQFFLDQGIKPERLILEGKSRNTAENARLSLALAAPQDSETWALITSAFHMPRAMRSFEATGWQGLVAWPVDYRTGSFAAGTGWDLTRNLGVLNTAVRESIGQLVYTMRGR